LARSFEFVEHTADIAARLTGDTVGALFEAAAAALTDAITDRSCVRSTDSFTVTLDGSDLDVLLVDWLEELLYRFETEGLLVGDSDVAIAEGDRVVLNAHIGGERRDAARHPIKVLVKAITFHGLHITKTDNGYEATVVFDI
jgi:SHS2 domain-containing protein